MPASKYTSFQIKNTASIPMEVSLTDPDGNSHTVGPLDPGEESIQVAPIGTIWSIKFVPGEVRSSSEAMKSLVDDTKPGSDATKPGSDATKPGSDATKPGSDATKPGSDATKPGSDATKPGSDATKPGSDATKVGEDATN
jgi:hypothetical protein